jgi:uncharacterized membrane protein YeaQ/YmgE (transglycosylase-associated protein family)
MLLLAILVVGLMAGWVAHLVVGRNTPDSWSTHLVVGLAGSLLAGLTVSLLAGDGLRLRLTGLLGSIAGAIVILAVWELIDSRNRAKAPPKKGRARR